jgi:hypothetical protein
MAEPSNVVALHEPDLLEFFRWPGPSDRTFIVGQNGTGKTQFAVWLLSHQDFDKRPWVIIDYKREQLFTKLRRMKALRGELKPSASVPKAPGLYLMRPMQSDDGDVDDFLWRVWRKGKVGLYFDEGSMPPSGPNSAVAAILTQGRSLLIPVIALNQRPVEIDRKFKSEAKYIAMFYLIDRDDRKEMTRYMPIDPDGDFPDFRPWWYDSSRRNLMLLPKAPDAATLLARIAERAPRRVWF